MNACFWTAFRPANEMHGGPSLTRDVRHTSLPRTPSMLLDTTTTCANSTVQLATMFNSPHTIHASCVEFANDDTTSSTRPPHAGEVDVQVPGGQKDEMTDMDGDSGFICPYCGLFCPTIFVLKYFSRLLSCQEADVVKAAYQPEAHEPHLT
jgi:hypothetical protein